MPSELHKDAAAFYLNTAKGSSAEEIMTPEAANRLADVFELCYGWLSQRGDFGHAREITTTQEDFANGSA